MTERDTKPTHVSAKYRKIVREIAEVAEIDRILQNEKVVLYGHLKLDVPEAVIAELKLEYAAKVLKLKGAVGTLPNAFTNNGKTQAQ